MSIYFNGTEILNVSGNEILNEMGSGTGLIYEVQFNGTIVWPTKPISVWWGGASNGAVHLINKNGQRVGNERFVGYLEYNSLAAAGFYNCAAFYGGNGKDGLLDTNTQRKEIRRFSPSGTQLGSLTFADTISTEHSGASKDQTGIFFGVGTLFGDDTFNRVIRINSSGSQIGGAQVISGATPRQHMAGCNTQSYAIFYGGAHSVLATANTVYNNVTRITTGGHLVGQETHVGVGRVNAGGAGILGIATFYGGSEVISGAAKKSLIRMNDSGTQIGGETSISASGSYASTEGASMSDVGIFTSGSSCIRVDVYGNKIGVETSISQITSASGAGIV